MASIPNNIVAKDSGGNVKKLLLGDILSEYATKAEVQDLVSSSWPTALADAEISLQRPTIESAVLPIPFTTSTVKLSTYGYDAEEPVYETEFELEERTLSSTTDAYRFSISGTASPFGVLSTQRCFLVLSLGGMAQLGSTAEYSESGCRQSGAVGGNPIILDWNSVVLGEGGTYSFAYRDTALADGFGVFGVLNLQRRTEYTGNIHKYNFRLDFTICANAAWKQFRESTRLILSTKDTLDAVEQSEVDLSPLLYPQISEISLQNHSTPMEAAGGVETFSETLSGSSSSTLKFDAYKGIVMALEQKDELDAANDAKVISIGLDLGSIIGSGIVLDAQDDRLSVPQFSSEAAGIVPPSIEDAILTSEGWKSFNTLGIPRNIVPFLGATESSNGENGLVPAPTIADRGSFLRGDGTWAPSLETLAGEFTCHWSRARKNVSFGIGIYDRETGWRQTVLDFEAELRPNETEERTISLQTAPEDVHGLFACHPFDTDIPIALEGRRNGWVGDKTFWRDNPNGAYTVHFDDGSAVGAWIEPVEYEVQVEIPADENDPDAESQYVAETRYDAVLHVKMYAPQAESPRMAYIKIDDNVVVRNDSAAAGEELELVATGEVSVCSLPTPNSILYDTLANAVEPENPASQEGGSGGDGDGDGENPDSVDSDEVQAVWIALLDQPQWIDGIKLQMWIDNSYIRAATGSFDDSEWPEESAGMELSIDYGIGTEEIDFSCLSNWLNSRFAYIQNAIQGGGASADIFRGATAISSGKPGLVPSATPQDVNKVLTGGGIWQDVSIDVFKGADEESGGDRGLVPAPTAAEADLFLKGDGTWGHPVQNLDAVTSVSLARASFGVDKNLSTDYESSLSNANALLQLSPQGKIWIREGGVSTSGDQGDTGVAVQREGSEIHMGLFWNDLDEESGVTEYTESIQTDVLSDGENTLVFTFNDGEASIEASVEFSESEGSLSILSLKTYTHAQVDNVYGLTFAKQNIIDGTESSQTIDLSFTGATLSSSGTSGLVPCPSKNDYGKVLSAQGEWIPIDLSTLTCAGYQKADGNSGEPLHIIPSDSVLTALGKLEGYIHGTLLSDRYVSLASDQTITGLKTFIKNIIGSSVALQNGTIDVSSASVFSKTVDDDIAFTFTGVPSGASASFSLALEDGASHEITWPNNIVWPNGEPPELKEDGIDLLKFQTWDGGQTWHFVSGSVPVYEGATAQAPARTGTVPPALSAEKDRFLKGDGTWAAAVTGVSGEYVLEGGRVVNSGTLDSSSYPVFTGTVMMRTESLGTFAAADLNDQLVDALPVSPVPEGFITSGAVYWSAPFDIMEHSSFYFDPNDPDYADAVFDGLQNTVFDNFSFYVYFNFGTGLPIRPYPVQPDDMDETLDKMRLSISSPIAFTAPAVGGTLTISDIQGITVETNYYTYSNDDDPSYNGNFFDLYGGTVDFLVERVSETVFRTGFRWTSPNDMASSAAVRITAESSDGTTADSDIPIPEYEGATTSSYGSTGLVPAAAPAERDRFLRGDGEWAEVVMPSIYQGATASSAGTAGLVPSASSANRDKFLRGDGTWGSDIVVTENMPTEDMQGSLFFYVEEEESGSEGGEGSGSSGSEGGSEGSGS